MMPYVQAETKLKLKILKIELKTLLLSCAIYTNVRAHGEPTQISKTEISAKTNNSF